MPGYKRPPPLASRLSLLIFAANVMQALLPGLGFLAWESQYGIEAPLSSGVFCSHNISLAFQPRPLGVGTNPLSVSTSLISLCVASPF